MKLVGRESGEPQELNAVAQVDVQLGTVAISCVLNTKLDFLYHELEPVTLLTGMNRCLCTTWRMGGEEVHLISLKGLEIMVFL